MVKKSGQSHDIFAIVPSIPKKNAINIPQLVGGLEHFLFSHILGIVTN
jgi:hypothetical protein